MSRSSSTLLPDRINLLLGALLFVSPWLLGFSGEQTAALNAQIFGALIVVLTLAEMFTFKMWEEWISGAVGVWLLFAPFILGFNQMIPAFAIHILVGMLAIIMVVWSATDHDSGHLTHG